MSQTSTPKSAAQSLEEQKKRFAALQERRTRAQIRLETERAALQALQEEARAAFNTADLDELRQKARDGEAENERLLAEFTAKLNACEQALGDIERQINF